MDEEDVVHWDTTEYIGICDGILLSLTKKNEMMPFAAATWADLEMIRLRRRSGETSTI